MRALNFDEEKTAVINPDDVVDKVNDCPKIVVTCFAHNLMEHAIKEYNANVFTYLHSTNREVPIYKVKIKDQWIGLYMTSVGAPCSVAEYEELFAMGVEHIIVFGTCGVLDERIGDCEIIIPTLAFRDEGCSYHYAASSDTIGVNVESLKKIKFFFIKKNLNIL